MGKPTTVTRSAAGFTPAVLPALAGARDLAWSRYEPSASAHLYTPQRAAFLDGLGLEDATSRTGTPAGDGEG
ncbi:MAG TPA: hypothetical protein VLH75_00040 [Longimicrobiales bacterium]|nr:hypothetical protein [Longimicrobiales bacterium]